MILSIDFCSCLCIIEFFSSSLWFSVRSFSLIYFIIRYHKQKTQYFSDMHFLWTIGARSSTTSRFLLLKRLQSTQSTSKPSKSIFTYGKNGHYFRDQIDPNESVRFSRRKSHLWKLFFFCRNSPKFWLLIEVKLLVVSFEHVRKWVLKQWQYTVTWIPIRYVSNW